MKILQILILFTIINVIIGITNSEQTFGSKTNKLVSNKPRQAVAKEKNVEDDVPATDSIPDKYLKHSVSVFKDTFEDSKVTKKVWKMPDLGKEKSDMIGIEMMPGKGLADLWFSGDMAGKPTMRTKDNYEWPLTVNAEIEKNHKCSSHFIVVTTSKDFVWDWGTQDNAIKFVWNCDTKYILAKGQPETGAKGKKCDKTGKYNVKVVIKGGVVSFEDDKCGTMTARNLLPSLPVYVYVGADQDTPGMKSKFYKVELLTPPKAPPLPSGAVFGDDFMFMNDTRPRMWQRSKVFGKVDNGCGSMPGAGEALRFYGSKRSATTKVMDMHRGGYLETCVRYGSKTFNQRYGGRCLPMDDLDGMEIQWSKDGKKFRRLARYVAQQFSKMFEGENFECIRHRVDHKENSELMRPNLYLRYVQISDIDHQARRRMRPGQPRGQFALGRVLAISNPEPASETVMVDDLTKVNTRLWAYPPNGAKAIKYGYESNSVWFSGSAEGQQMMTTKQTFRMGMKINAIVDKSSKCNSHFIALSSNKRSKWSWGTTKGMWKFAWNCDTKYIYAPDGRVAKAKCAHQTRYNVEINIERGAVIFKDGVCKPLLIPSSPSPGDQFYVHIGADDDEAKSKARFMHFEVKHLLSETSDAANIFESKLLVGEFKFFDEKNWKAPRLTTGKSAQFGFLKENAVWFSGDYSEMTPMRATQAFPMPFGITAQINKNDECSSQFIVISTDPNFKWGWGPQKNAIKFAWNCDDKYLYGTNKKAVTKTKCDKKGDYKLQISVFENQIAFGDDECGALTIPNGLKSAKELFVFIGADQDQPGQKSKIFDFTVTGPLRPPVIKDRRIMMQDNFEFKDAIFEPMWSMNGMTGKVDKACGAVSGSSLHMSNTGPRIATTKAVDMSKGAKLDFSLRFGGSSAQCGGMRFDGGGNDGIEIQASRDDGKTWKKIIRYDARYYGKMLKNWKKMSVTIDEINGADVLSDSTMVRFIQPQNNKACCGHWALDNVVIWNLEEPGEILIDDVFRKANATAWQYPETSKESKCQYGMENNLWFKGDCSGRTPMRTKLLMSAKQGVTINAEVDKDAPCANHWIAIAPSKHLRWVAGKKQQNVIKIGWNCDQKYIMTPTKVKTQSCGANKNFEVTIKVTKGLVKFADNVCEDLEFDVPAQLTQGPFYVYVGADRFDTKADGKSKFNKILIEQAAASPFEKFTVPIYTDDFTKKNDVLWEYPPAKQNMKKGKENGACTFKRSEGSVAFHGDCVNAKPMRLKPALKTPVTIFADVNKNSDCSSHYMVISPYPGYTWSWETQSDAIKFAWNCNEKYIYGKTHKQDSKVKCANKGMYKMEVSVEDGLLTFKDGQCAALTMRNPYPANQTFYVYIGADQDEQNTPSSEFSGFSVEAPEEPPKLDNVTIMYDNFDFHDNLYPPMWLKEETTGRVDQECGAVNGKSLRFYNQGVRSATSKLLDLSYGGSISFFMKFGGGEGPACMKMSDFKDGVELQYRTELKGEGNDTSTGVWKRLRDYTVSNYGKKLSKGFENITNIIINWDKYPDAMTTKTRLRWIQHNENAQPCCDHWALDNVKVEATPYPKRPSGLPKDTLIFDNFESGHFGGNPVWFNMFETTGRASKILSEDGSSSMIFKNKGERTLTTKPFDLMYGGASLGFNMKYVFADTNGKLPDVSKAIGVELQYSLDDGMTWKRMSYYEPRKNPQMLTDFVRVRVEVGGRNFKGVLSHATSFRWVQRRARGKGMVRPLWAIDQVDLHTGDQRIGMEDTTMSKEDKSIWCYQPNDTITPYSYSYPKFVAMNSTNQTNQTKLAFQGDVEGKSTVRSKVSFKVPMAVVAKLDKTDECSNHFIAISRRKYFTWNWNQDRHSIKFAWRCDKKVLITPDTYKSTMCPQEKQYKIEAKVSNGTITFTDANGCAALEARLPEGWAENKVERHDGHDLYVYVGAAHPGNTPFHPARINPQFLQIGESVKVDVAAPGGTEYNGDVRDVTRTGQELTAEERARMKWPEECRSIYCPAKIDPVCGSDAKTYDNECLLMLERCKRGKEGKSLKTAYSGACQKFAEVAPSTFDDIKIIGQGSLIHNDDGSRACPQLVHCKVSQYSEWSNCSESCDKGISTRFRSVIRHPKHGGDKCPVLNETKTCFKRKCDCAVSEWSKWSVCDQECGGGNYHRFREILREPMGKGLSCPALNESRTCNEQRCAFVGLPFKGQTETMLTNSPKERFLSYNKKEFCYQDKKNLLPYAYGYNGNAGGVWFTGSDVGRSTMRSRKSFQTNDLVIETEISKNMECANHFIVVSPRPYNLFNYESEEGMIKFFWKCDKKTIVWPTGSASVDCPKLRNYKINITIEGNKVLFEDDYCEPLRAPLGPSRDVFVYIGANYGPTGKLDENRTKEIEEEEGDIDEDDNKKVKEEDDDEDDKKVAFLEKEEAAGRHRRRPRGRRAKRRQETAAEKAERRRKGLRAARKAKAGKRSKNDGKKNKRRNRAQVQQARNRKDEAKKQAVERKEEKDEDDEDEVADLNPDTNEVVAPANKTDDEARELAAGDEPNRAVFKWLRVSGQGSSINRENGTSHCPDIIDCRVSIWSEWTNCSAPCDGGNSTRTRMVYVHPRLTGKKCGPLIESKQCNTRECDCGVTKFTPWSPCTAECDGGTKFRKRKVFREPMADGAACPNLNETAKCNQAKCAIMGVPHIQRSGKPLVKAPWDTLMTRNNSNWCYQIEKAIAPYHYGYLPEWIGGGMWFGGNGFGKTTVRSKLSYTLPLRIDFAFERDQTCSNQYIVVTTAERYLHSWDMEPETVKFSFNCAAKTINSEYLNDRTRCPLHIKAGMSASITLRKDGSVKFKDSNCEPMESFNAAQSLRGKDVFVYMGAALPPTMPSVTKSVFNKVRISGEGTLNNAFNGSDACPKLVDCETSSWSNWTQCTVPCGGGNRSRTRTVLKQPEWGGRKCGVLNQTIACNTQHCGRDCQLTNWGTWSNCSKVCGGGVNTRTREIFTSRINGTIWGKDQCPPLKEEKKCNTQHCGKDCVVGEWTDWTLCNAPCGGGGQKRQRAILVHPVVGSHAGKQCPHLMEERQCNTQECPMKEGPQPITKSKCDSYTNNCKACTADPECGYCPSTGKCFIGNPDGPIPRFSGDTQFLTDHRKQFMYLTNCSSWQFAFCQGEPCREYSNCKGCLSDSFCGWCSATNTCTEGDAAGSYGEFCPRGWVHSPMHTGVGVRNRNDLLLSPRQVHEEKSRLGEFCEANTQEQRNMIQEKMEAESVRQKRLTTLRETCLPCQGTWPNCVCKGTKEIPTRLRPLTEEMVARQADEAFKIDQSLPRNGTEKGKWDHGKGLKQFGATCFDDGACSSNQCADRCCKPETRGCSGHGVCDQRGDCVCEEGWLPGSCNITLVEHEASQVNQSFPTGGAGAATGVAQPAPAPVLDQEEPYFDLNTTEGVMAKAKWMMEKKMNESIHQSRTNRVQIKENTKVVKEDIDAMQKALNEKLATRAKLAQEEMENTRSEMNTKRREETMKYDEAKNKILDAQQNLVKQQDMKRIETEQQSKSAQDEAKQFEAERKLANDRQKKMENEKESAAKESVAGLQQINAAKAENEMRAARALQVDQKAELADSESKKAAEAGIKLAALKEQQKAAEGEEQSSLQNGKAVANDAKVSQIMQETKNRLAQESARN